MATKKSRASRKARARTTTSAHEKERHLLKVEERENPIRGRALPVVDEDEAQAEMLRRKAQESVGAGGDTAWEENQDREMSLTERPLDPRVEAPFPDERP